MQKLITPLIPSLVRLAVPASLGVLGIDHVGMAIHGDYGNN